jgi:hypothetical protein
MIVHVTDSFYRGIPTGSASYFAWEFITAWTNVIAGGPRTFRLVNVPVPTGQMLDIAQIRFFVCYFASVAPSPQPRLFADEALLNTRNTMRVLVSEKMPWDITTTTVLVDLGPPFVLNDPPRPGFRWLNRNMLSDWGDIPAHLIVPEGNSFQLDADMQTALPCFPAPNDTLIVGAIVQGRWLSKQEWAALKERR